MIFRKSKTHAGLLFSASLLFSILGAKTFAAHDLPISDLRVRGLKYPNVKEEGFAPVTTHAWTTDLNKLGGFTDLVEFVIATPDQEEAGSCLYMSLTGVLEWWMAKINPKIPRTLGGPIDLSERWYMNVAGDDAHNKDVADWRTDSIYGYNSVAHGALDRDYRFARGWTLRTDEGAQEAKPGDPQAEYSTYYNWIDQRGLQTGTPVPTPQLERSLLFVDPEHNQWNVGVMPGDIIERVKHALTTHRAPVHILYNHFGYWHAVYIAGFDDDRSTRGCEFVEGSYEHFKDEIRELDVRISNPKTPEAERVNLIKRRAKNMTFLEKLTLSRRKYGACNEKGVFYVRDSIYGSENEPDYVYDPKAGEKGKGHYSKRIIMLEYAWLQHLANHAAVYVLKK